jgi:hypothetical protein
MRETSAGRAWAERSGSVSTHTTYQRSSTGTICVMGTSHHPRQHRMVNPSHLQTVMTCVLKCHMHLSRLRHVTRHGC